MVRRIERSIQASRDELEDRANAPEAKSDMLVKDEMLTAKLTLAPTSLATLRPTPT
jgi:hypothetical protein